MSDNDRVFVSQAINTWWCHWLNMDWPVNGEWVFLPTFCAKCRMFFLFFGCGSFRNYINKLGVQSGVRQICLLFTIYRRYMYYSIGVLYPSYTFKYIIRDTCSFIICVYCPVIASIYKCIYAEYECHRYKCTCYERFTTQVTYLCPGNTIGVVFRP